MKTRKLVTLLTVAALSVGALAGCGDSSSASSNNSAASTTSTAADTTATSTTDSAAASAASTASQPNGTLLTFPERAEAR